MTPNPEPAGKAAREIIYIALSFEPVRMVVMSETDKHVEIARDSTRTTLNVHRSDCYVYEESAYAEIRGLWEKLDACWKKLPKDQP